MAFSLSWRKTSRRLTSWACWGLCSLAGGSWVAWAAGASAPFKPPSSLSPGQAPWVASGPAGSAATPIKPHDELGNPPAGLMGLKLGAHRSALIDGHWLKVGQSARGAQLVDINNEGVHLRHANGRREIWGLSPQAQWTPRTPPVKVKAP